MRPTDLEAPPRSLDVIRCLTFIKDDPGWLRKVLFGSLASLLAVVLVGMPLVWGYSLRLVRRTAQGLEPPLPEWDDWGGIFMDGLKVALVLVAHYIAAGLLLTPLVLVFMMVPGNLDDPSGVLVLALFAMMSVAFVMLMLFGVYVHAAIVRMAVLGDLAEAFKPAEIVEFLRRNLGNTALAWVAFIIANFASQFGFLLCCIGLLPATFWAVTVMFFSMGEVVRLDLEMSVSSSA